MSMTSSRFRYNQALYHDHQAIPTGYMLRQAKLGTQRPLRSHHYMPSTEVLNKSLGRWAPSTNSHHAGRVMALTLYTFMPTAVKAQDMTDSLTNESAGRKQKRTLSILVSPEILDKLSSDYK